jgi:hypothetical protein
MSDYALEVPFEKEKFPEITPRGIMAVSSFVVPGKPQGYYAEGKRPNWTRKKSYEAYKKHVKQCAALAGCHRERLVATKERPLLIHTKAYFPNGVHCDPENNRKAISDALFWTRRNEKKGYGDKYCGGSFWYPLYDKENPRTEVIIERVKNV